MVKRTPLNEIEIHSSGGFASAQSAKSVQAMIPTVIHWNPQWGPVSEEAMAARLRAEGWQVSKYHYPAGTYFPWHTHAEHKKDAVVRGRLRIGWEGGSAVLEPGDMIEIPAGTRHSAEVVGAETVMSLDATRD